MSKIDTLYSIKFQADILAYNILEEGQYITNKDAKVIRDHLFKAMNRFNLALERSGR